MKTIKDAVIELGGIYPVRESGVTVGDEVLLVQIDFSPEYPEDEIGSFHAGGFGCDYEIYRVVCTRSEFESCAKRLGYINGYRWGVEYPTNGKRPDLADDVICGVLDEVCGWCNDENEGNVGTWKWFSVKAFRITDQRFKPADTSYLYVKQQDHIVEANEKVSEWWDYDKLQVKSGKLIPVDSDVLFFDRAPNPFKCKVMYSSEYVTVIRCIDGSVNKEMIGVDISRCPFEESFNQIKPLDWNRKAEMDREKVIEAAMNVAEKDCPECGIKILGALYNAGMLVLPSKKSDTKD